MNNDNFEEMMIEVDNAIEQLESGKLSLDESIKLYTHAVSVTKKCFKQLEDAKLEIEKVNNELTKEDND